MNRPNAQTSGLGFVGQSVKRVEDDRLLRGEGRYVADVVPAGCLHAAFVRSPFPHARITSIDTTAAKAMPGVVTVGTGADIEALTKPFVPLGQQPNSYVPLHYALSSDKVRHVGDPVAIVVATSRALAEDAAEAVVVDYDQLPGVGSIARALAPSSAQVWERADHNLLFDRTDTHGDVEAVFAAADHVFTETFTCPRQSNQPMEPRGITVEVDGDDVTVRAATQSSHALRWMLAATTERKPAWRSAKDFVTNTARRSSFLAAAKQLAAEKGDALGESDSTAMLKQLKTDPSTVLHLGRTLVGLTGKDRYPSVVADDIGGGFGSKGSVNREDVAVAAVALALGRSVTWVEDRVENLMDGGQAREEELTVSIACDADGTMRGLKVDLVMDQGAYPAAPFGAAMFTQIMRVMQPGSYRFEAFEQRSRIVATNKGKYVAYRGPWANETWVRERMVNVVARELGLDQVEIRRRNMWTHDELAVADPPRMITGPQLDVTMSVRGTLDRAVELAALDGARFEERRLAAASEGKALGVGFASYHEAAPGPPDYFDHVSPGTTALMGQPTRATVAADGTIRVFTPQMPHGQSHETTYAQIAADELGVGIDDIEVVYGDTERTPFELLGTGGSRGGPIGGGSIRKSGRSLRSAVVEHAAEMLEANPADVTIADGNIHVAGVPARGLTFAEVAADRHERHGGEVEAVFDVDEDYTGAGDGGWSVATHVCWVEIDLETGKVAIPRYLVVEDCGPIINPAIVDGQVRGGVAQGVGAVLYERVAYDDDANLASTTYMDYLLPTAMEVPEIEIDHLETLSEGENDFRGVGEGGMIGAPAALTNAIEDALAPLGVRITEQYLPPTRILELAGVIEPD